MIDKIISLRMYNHIYRPYTDLEFEIHTIVVVTKTVRRNLLSRVIRFECHRCLPETNIKEYVSNLGREEFRQSSHEYNMHNIMYLAMSHRELDRAKQIKNQVFKYFRYKMIGSSI